MIVFVATIKENSKFVDLLIEQGFSPLHPFYEFKSCLGESILGTLDKSPQKYNNYWETVLRKDLFCIENSKLVLYDFDNLPEEGRYLSMAVSLNKPIIGISEFMKAPPVYFSGSIISIIKSKQVVPMLNFIREHNEFIALPGIIEGAVNESIPPDTGVST